MSTPMAPAEVEEKRLATVLNEVDESQPARHPRASAAQPADLCPHLGLRPFRPRSRRRTAASPGSGPISPTSCGARSTEPSDSGAADRDPNGRQSLRPAPGPAVAARPADAAGGAAAAARVDSARARAVSILSALVRSRPTRDLARDRLRRRRALAAQAAAPSARSASSASSRSSTASPSCCGAVAQRQLDNVRVSSTDDAPSLLGASRASIDARVRAVSRPLAEAAPPQAPHRLRRDACADAGPRLARRRRAASRHRRSGLMRLDAGAAYRPARTSTGWREARRTGASAPADWLPTRYEAKALRSRPAARLS